MNDINDEILKLIREIDNTKNRKEKKLIHFKSVNNFFIHLLKDLETNNKLNKIKRRKYQELLLVYLKNIINNRSLHKEKSIDNFHKYIYPIGLYMSEYYSFSGIGNSLLIYGVFAFLIGVFIDIGVFFIFGLFPFIFILLISLIIIRFFIKLKANRIYGLFW